MMWSIWNNSFLNCGCRWKWRMIIAVNFHLMLLKEEASNFLLWDFKNEIFSSVMLKNFSSHWTWKLSWKFNVSIISMNVNKIKLPATKGFTIVQCRLWNMVHGSILNWNRCISNSLWGFIQQVQFIHQSNTLY